MSCLLIGKDKIIIAEVMITLNAHNKFTLLQRKHVFLFEGDWFGQWLGRQSTIGGPIIHHTADTSYSCYNLFSFSNV